jgi:hypothetical protein
LKDNQDNHVEWQKAYALFAKKSDWYEIPTGSAKCWQYSLIFNRDILTNQNIYYTHEAALNAGKSARKTLI